MKQSISLVLCFLSLLVLGSDTLAAQGTAVSKRIFSLGTNLGGLVDYSTELPFVDLMHNARTWYTKDLEDPEWDGPWNTELATRLTFRPDGYPTHIPQTIPGQKYGQKVATIWGDARGWPEGTYTVLFDGKGELAMAGAVTEVQNQGNRLTFAFSARGKEHPTVELLINKSEAKDPVRNIRVLMPGTEKTYQDQPFNPLWVARLKDFQSVRFMDWGATNGWGQIDPWTWDDKTLFDWKSRADPAYYTWADGRGIPFEMMIRLMNEQGLDGWVCVPHRASAEFIRKMAELFKAGLKKDRTLTVEFSNESWNWMFGQAQWLRTYGHPSKTAIARVGAQANEWPEKITGNIQDCLDIWTEVWGSDLKRLRRVVGLQTAWLDVSQRISFNLRPGSFDAVSPAFYFGLGEEADKELDALGSKATVADVARLARKNRDSAEIPWLRAIKKELADKLQVPMVFYEGGQHLTPTPFGQEPSYGAALLAIQRDPVMETLYREWFTFLKTLRQGTEPLTLMNFSFVGSLSAQYGSWGLLETLDQDLTKIPAPKYRAVLDAMKW